MTVPERRVDAPPRPAASVQPPSPQPSSPPVPSGTNPHKGRQGLTRIFHATRNSLSGLRIAYREESAFRQEVWMAATLLPCTYWLAGSWLEATVLVGSLVLVLIVELLNSAIEATVDRISFELHDLSGRAKDLASAAVMLSLALCATLWLSALVRKLM